MTEIRLGRLGRKDAREVWTDEARQFTPWLLENIGLLGDALGVDINPEVQREVAVGLFAADLLGSESGSQAAILVENQLEDTDHKHLGQLLTYAGGLSPEVLIWVAPKIRDEHRQALLWLNEQTDETVRFFGVELEVLTIDDSEPAPHFKIVVAPTEWQKTRTGQASVARGMSPERAKRFREFFRAFLEEVLKRDPQATSASPESAGSNPWCFLRFGRRGTWCSFVFGWKVVRVEVFVDIGNRAMNDAAFDQLEAQQHEIEAELGQKMIWVRRRDESARRCTVFVEREGSIEDSPEALEDLRQWGVERLLKVREVFTPRVRALSVEPATQSEIAQPAPIE
jgi:hypothetical protein